MAHVTAIIATYRRADALRCTLEALTLQTHTDWDAIVVGDACDASTEAAVRAVGDPRIAYYNLPQRVGEQSGPNSIGLAIARGDVVAFVNHDDLLLPDHFAYGLAALADADVFLGRGAKTVVKADGVPAFAGRIPRSTDRRRLIGRWPYAFEPCSFWLIRTTYARRVGPWRSARTLVRTPLQDWLLRAWRLGGRFVDGERMTGLKLGPPPRTAGPSYDHGVPGATALLARLRAESPDALRADMQAQIAALPPRPSPDRFPRAKHLATGALAGLYRATGLDLVALVQGARGQRGARFAAISANRTGAPLPAPPDVAALAAAAETFRVV